MKRIETLFAADGHDHYFDCGDGFMGVYIGMLKLVKLCAVNLQFVSHPSIKLFFKGQAKK